MAAATADRDTQEKIAAFSFDHGCLGTDSTQFYKGTQVGIDLSTGRLVNAIAADLNVQVVGCCSENRLTLAGASNTKRVQFRSGIFNYASGTAGEAIVEADRGQVCYVLDNQTVGLDGNTAANSIAGRIYDVDADGVWVATQFPLPQLAPSGASGV